MSKKIFILIAMILFASNGFSQWSKQGLHHLSVYEMKVQQDTIYACTSDGIFARHFLKQDDPWEAVGLQGHDVTDVFFGNNGRMLANVRTKEPFYSSVYIKDTDTFELLAEHELVYGGSHNFRMLTATQSLDTIFDLSANKKTYDGGETWHGMFEAWNIYRFVKIDPNHPNKIWVGGESANLTPILSFSTDYGNNFENLPLHMNYFDGDNCTHWIIRKDTSWFVPGEGVIGRSNDGGFTWETLLNTWGDPDMALYFYDISFSPADSTIVYTTGDAYNNNNISERLNIIYSTDEGKNWQHEWHQFEEDHKYPVTNMLVMHDDGRDIIFLGADGIYAFEHSEVSTPDQPDASFAWDIYPNPASRKIYIQMQNPPVGQLTISIHDLHGRTIRQERIQQMSSDNDEHVMHVGNLEPGAYMISISHKNNKQTRRLIIQ